MAASMVCRRSFQNLKQYCLRKNAIRQFSDRKNSTTGAYFIFIPEVPSDTKDTNPIMRHNEYPAFSELYNANIISGCAKLAQEFDSKLDKYIEDVVASQAGQSFEDLFDFIEEILTPLQYADNQANILNLVDRAKYPKSMYDRVKMQVDRSKNDRYVSKEFYSLLMKIKKRRNSLTEEQKRLLDLNLLECQLAGAESPEGKEKVLSDCYRMINRKEDEFLEKSIYHKSLFGLDLGPTMWNIVKQLPQHVRLSVAVDKMQPDKGPWKISLLPYVYESFLETCPRRDYRYKVWNSNHTVGTHLTTDIRLHTFDIVNEIRQARGDIAKHLGYENFAELSLKSMMAGNVKTVFNMLDIYKKVFLPKAKEDLKSLHQFATDKGMKMEIKQWDIPYYKRLQAEHLYKVTKIDKQGYFSMENVLNTMLNLSEKLFQIKFERVPPETVDVWHKDVTVYNVYNTDGTYVSRFYLDPFARRESKVRTNSTELCRDGSQIMDVTPISVLLLSLNKITFPGVPTLMSFKEVLTMFYEFGNVLQQMLTTCKYSEVSGQRNIEMDATHVCSYVMKMFAMEPHVIEEMSEHYQTKEKLTTDQISNLIECQKHLASYDICHELYKSAFDLGCHLDGDKSWKEVQAEMYKMFMPIELHNEDWIWCSDHTLWIGRSHAAAYYQYMWSEMLAANIFEEFQEGGTDNEKNIAKVGKRFRDTYLSLGGGLEAKLVFRHFIGRDPSYDCLIKKYINQTHEE